MRKSASLGTLVPIPIESVTLYTPKVHQSLQGSPITSLVSVGDGSFGKKAVFRLANGQNCPIYLLSPEYDLHHPIFRNLSPADQRALATYLGVSTMNQQITVANVTTSVLAYQGLRVVTTKQLAEFYGCDPINIQQNFSNNKDRFEEGKHYVRITGAQVTDFIRYSKISNTEIPDSTTVLVLWLEKGAARHAKMLSTDQAWEVFEELEDSYFREKQSAVAMVPQTFAQALRAAADLAEQKELAERQRDEAIATKALIGNRREATAMATASVAVREVMKLERELDRSKQYATVKRMEMIYHGQKFNWRLLKSTAAEMGIPPNDIYDANYGTVKAYHADVWREAYAIEIIDGDDSPMAFLGNDRVANCSQRQSV